MRELRLNCRGKILSLSPAPIVMGILNVTPDSFSDGGEFIDPAQAVDKALSMVAEGAAVIDIGGESTRPGAEPVSPEEQIRRVLPVIKGLAAQSDTPISIDTTSSKVAAAALDAGAAIINDISALRFDAGMAGYVAQAQVPVVLMHMQGAPRSMQANPTYVDVVQEVKIFLAERIEFAVAAGIARAQIVIDPGIGFGKALEHNLLLLRRLAEFGDLAVPLLVGPSRKSFIGKVLDVPDPHDRLWGTAAAVACCVVGGAEIIRVHDVREMSQVVRLAAAICR